MVGCNYLANHLCQFGDVFNDMKFSRIKFRHALSENIRKTDIYIYIIADSVAENMCQ